MANLFEQQKAFRDHVAAGGQYATFQDFLKSQTPELDKPVQQSGQMSQYKFTGGARRPANQAGLEAMLKKRAAEDAQEKAGGGE